MTASNDEKYNWIFQNRNIAEIPKDDICSLCKQTIEEGEERHHLSDLVIGECCWAGSY